MQELAECSFSRPGVVRVWLVVLCCLALPAPGLARPKQKPTNPPGLQATLAAQKSLFSSLHDLTKMEGATRTVHTVMEHYVELPSFIAGSFNLAPVLSFIASSPLETDPLLMDLMQTVEKIDAILEELDLLKRKYVGGFWKEYDELCSNHETNIRESWKFLKDFLIRGPTAKTMEVKSRLAGKFTDFFSRSQTDNSVAKLYEYVFGNIRRQDNLLKRFLEDTNKDFYHVNRFSSYLSGVLILGQQMKVYCHLLADTSGASSAEEAMRLITNLHFATLEALATTIDNFMRAAELDGYRKATETTADHYPTITASKAAKHMNEKYNWLRWTAVAIESRPEPKEACDILNRISSQFWLCINHAPLDHSVTTTLSCSAEECKAPAGTCKDWQAVGVHFCKCAKNFYSPNCSRNVQQDIEESRLMSWDHPIIVPDLASIYYSIMDLKNLLRKSQ